ncbi:MAG: hypothetical protein JWN04_49 [Myxococcaceae bacterium]|nr:hypothetical protein [Myxococcaceae bacterium]
MESERRGRSFPSEAGRAWAIDSRHAFFAVRPLALRARVYSRRGVCAETSRAFSKT